MMVVMPSAKVELIKRNYQSSITTIHQRDNQMKSQQNKALNELTKLNNVIHASGDFPDGATTHLELQNRDYRRVILDFPQHSMLNIMSLAPVPSGEEVRQQMEMRSRKDAWKGNMHYQEESPGGKGVKENPEEAMDKWVLEGMSESKDPILEL